MAIPALSRPALEHRPFYKSRPAGSVVEAFLRHVKDTGSPETFSQVSTTRPPETKDVVVLTHFNVNRNRRRSKDMVPCPICSPHSEKFLHGVLIWCPESACIYAIGYECADTVFGVGRLRIAINAHDQERQQREVEDLLLEKLPLVPSLRGCAEAMLVHAEAIDKIGTGLCKSRRLKALLVRSSRDGYLIHTPAKAVESESTAKGGIELLAPMLGGKSLNRAQWNLASRIRIADQKLSWLYCGDTEDEVLNFVCNIPTAHERRKALDYLRAGHAELKEIAEIIGDVAEFCRDDNLTALASWSRHPGGPQNLSVFVAEKWFKITLGTECWYELKPPSVGPDPLPELSIPPHLRIR